MLPVHVPLGLNVNVFDTLCKSGVTEPTAVCVTVRDSVMDGVVVADHVRLRVVEGVSGVAERETVSETVFVWDSVPCDDDTVMDEDGEGDGVPIVAVLGVGDADIVMVALAVEDVLIDRDAVVEWLWLAPLMDFDNVPRDWEYDCV